MHVVNLIRLLQNGQHYHFTTKEQFCQEITEGLFLEYAELHGRS
jgi:guanylate kinase